MRAIALVVLLCGCGIDEFDVEQPIEPEQRVEGTGLPLLGMLFDFPIAIDIRAQIEARDTGPIDAITLKSLVLEITATAETPPDTDDWSFVDRVEIFVSSTKSGSALPKDVRIAAAVAPGAVRRMRFEPEPGVNLRPYIEEGAQMTAEAEGSAPPDDFGGVGVFRVDPL